MFRRILKTLGIHSKKTKKSNEERIGFFQGSFDSYILSNPTQY